MDLPTSTMNPSNVSKTKIWSHHFPCSNSSLDFCHSWDKHRDPCCGSRASAASSVVVFWRLLSLAHWVTAPFTFLQLAPKSYLLHPKEPLLRMFLPFAWHILSPAGPPLTYSTPQTSHIGEAPLSWIFRLTHIPRSKHVCVCVLSHFSRVWLCNPMDCSPPGSSVHGILQERTLEWVATPSSRGPSPPRVSCLLHWQAGFLPLAPPGKPLYMYTRIFSWTYTVVVNLPICKHIWFSHPSTNQALLSLASKIRQDQTGSGWYGCGL